MSQRSRIEFAEMCGLLVVDSTGEHHRVKGLFVADGSLFPTSLGGPPQISIYAFAYHLSRHVIARARAVGP